MSLEIGSTTAHPHLSHVLQGPHDSSIPLYLPLLFGFLASFNCGILNFGEATTFTLLWNFARYISWLDQDVTFQKGVILSQVLSVFAQVPLLLVGWREFLHVAGYTCIMLGILNHFVAVGVHFLIFGHIRNTEAFCATLFMAFSSVKLLRSSLEFGNERAASRSGTKADTPRSRRVVKLDETETIVAESQEDADSELITGTPHWPSVRGFLHDHPRFRQYYECLFPAISVQGHAVETVVLVSSFCSALSGISQGITGSSGPPRILAYTVLDISKGAIRGLAGINLFSSVVLLYDVSTSHGSRLFMSSELQMYAALGVIALLGSSFGTWVRKFVPREGILYGLFWLVWAESSMLLHVFQDKTALVIYFTLSLVLVFGIIVCYLHPSRVVSWLYYLSSCFVSSQSGTPSEQQPLMKTNAALEAAAIAGGG